MNALERFAVAFAAGCLCAVVGHSIGVSQHAEPPSHVTICHTPAQTQCLWVDGHAEWH